MRRVLFALLLIGLISIPAVSTAQTDKADCDPSKVITSASALKSTGDTKKDMQALYTISQQITDMDIACNGFVFRSKGNKALDPFILPAGTWRVSVQTSEAIIVKVRTLSGSKCKPNAEASILNELNHEDDRAIDASGILPTEVDCKMILITENSDDDWTITFEPIE